MTLARRLLAGVSIVMVGTVMVAAGLWVTRPDPQAEAVLLSAASASQFLTEIGDAREISAAMRIEGDSRLLIDQNARRESSIASMAKVITALVVLEAAPLAPGEPGPTWIVTEADVELFVTLSLNGAVSLPLIEGLELNQRQLLEAMLVPSSAVHAYLLVENVIGSVDAYRAAAAEWLLNEGFGATFVVDPVGGSAVTRSTPAELLAIGERALAHPVIAEIVALPEAEVPSAGRVPNTNPFIGTLGIDGVKTGTLSSDAGYCLLFSIAPDLERGRPRIFGVVVGAATAAERVDLVEQMIDLASTQFVPVELQEGQTIARYVPTWSDSVDLVLAEPVSAVTWNGLAPRLDARALTSGREGDVVGTVEYWSSTGAREVEVRLAADLPEAPWWWRILHTG